MVHQAFKFWNKKKGQKKKRRKKKKFPADFSVTVNYVKHSAELKIEHGQTAVGLWQEGSSPCDTVAFTIATY